MKNTLILKVSGKSINRFLKRLNRLDVELLRIDYINDYILITIYKEDYDKVMNNKTIYEIEIIDFNGIDKIKYIINRNKYLLISFLIVLIIYYFLCNLIFNIEVVHNNPYIRKIIKEELKEKGIDKYKIKKTYEEKEKIKKYILDKYKDKLEWLEIKELGTKYVIRVEERVITKEKKDAGIRNIVAKKNASIIRIENKSGVALKNKNDYVKKGDIIITGNIDLNEETKNRVSATGTVYGEVWYKVTVSYPLNYYERRKLGHNKNILVFNFFDKNIDLTFKPFKDKDIKKLVILKNKFFPISFEYQKQEEVEVINQKLNYNEALRKAIKKAKDEVNRKLNEKEYIISVKKLKVDKNNSKIIVELFFSVCENITDYENIVVEEIGE